LEEDYWRKKYRSLWLKAGDKNTTYFHKQDEARIEVNSVKEIHLQDQVVFEFKGIKKFSHNHFKEIYTEEPHIHNENFQQILNLVPSKI